MTKFLFELYRFAVKNYKPIALIDINITSRKHFKA